MRPRWFGPVAVLALASVVPPAGAADKAPPPTLVLQIAPTDEWLAAAARVGAETAPLWRPARSSGRASPKPPDAAAVARQLDAVLFLALGADWRKGVDTTKPVGYALVLAPDFYSSSMALLVPVADPKTFRKVLGRIGVTVKEEGSVLRVEGLPIPRQFGVSLRFAHGYAYFLAHAPAADTAQLPAPADFFRPADGRLLRLTAHLDRIPTGWRDDILDNLSRWERPAVLDWSGDLPKLIAEQLFQQALGFLTLGLRDGKELALSLGLDRTSGELTYDLRLSAKPGTEFARLLGQAGRAEAGPLAGMRDGAAAHLACRLPAGPGEASAVEKWLLAVVAEVEARHLRPVLRAAVRPLARSLGGAGVEAAAALHGPDADGRYAVVAGLRVRDGAVLEKAVRTAVDRLSAEQRARYAWLPTERAATGGRILQSAAGPGKGDVVYFAFRADALLIGYGPDTLGPLRKAMAAASGVVPVALVEVDLARLVTPLAGGEAKAAERLRLAFADGAGRLRLVRVTADGATLGAAGAVRPRALAEVARLAGLGG